MSYNAIQSITMQYKVRQSITMSYNARQSKTKYYNELQCLTKSYKLDNYHHGNIFYSMNHKEPLQPFSDWNLFQ